MSNFALARALTTGVTVAALTTGILTVSVAAYAHGTGGQTGGGGPKGMATMTRAVGVHQDHGSATTGGGGSNSSAGYAGSSYGCLQARPGGATRVCGDIYDQRYDNARLARSEGASLARRRHGPRSVSRVASWIGKASTLFIRFRCKTSALNVS
jgi:hypothetical protein